MAGRRATSQARALLVLLLAACHGAQPVPPRPPGGAPYRDAPDDRDAAGAADRAAATEEDILLPGPGRHHALRDARVTVLRGGARRDGAADALQVGDAVARGAQVRVSAGDALLELTFADGTVVRAGAASHLTLVPGGRDVLLRAGAALVQADRMLGGVTVLTPTAACITEGTTYLARVTAEGDTQVEVYSGVVQVLRPRRRGPGDGVGRGLADGGGVPAEARLLVSGERLLAPRAGGLGGPARLDLGAALAQEPLLVAEGRLSRAPLHGLADQQRRGVLARYGERLRREIRWQRRREPITLPPLFQPQPGDEAPTRIAPPEGR